MESREHRAPRNTQYSLSITFTAEVIHWRGPAPYFYLVVPKKYAEAIKELSPEISFGWGMIPADCSSNGHEFYTALFPKDDTYYLPLRKDIRTKLGVELGDKVKVAANI